jgi:hypothetical protein
VRRDKLKVVGIDIAMPRPRLVSKTRKTAAEAALFGHRLTITLLNRVIKNTLTALNPKS